MWQLGEAIQQHRYVTITYGRIKDRKVVERRLKPLALLFSEYYFYLIAFIDDSKIQKIYESARDMTPTIYRLDRIKNLTVEKDLFRIPYNRRFQEGGIPQARPVHVRRPLAARDFYLYRQ